tara:strand:+ start:2731 stop:3414 length:684 start_codon:yes stop_codon:yes gene_type:complete
MDLVCFRAASSAEEEGFGIAKHRAQQLLDNILGKVKCTEYRAFLTGSTNFRKDILPTYKANRKDRVKPKHLKELQDYAINKMGAEWAPESLEADDSMAIHQTDDTIICTLDKDLLQVPGKHFSWEISGANWTRPDRFLTQTELEGNRLFFEQCIKGDTSDNVVGIKGLGDKKAKNMLQNCDTEQQMFEIVQDLYSDDDRFIRNASCLWMKRSIEDNWKDRFDAFIQE